MKAGRMRTGYIALVVSLLAGWAMSTVKTAFRFDPVFRLMQMRGSVMVQKPGEIPTKDLEGREVLPAALDRKAYPYGTRVVTGPDGQVNAFFNRISNCHIGPNSSVIFDEDRKDNRIKILRLEKGKLSIALEKGIEENGNRVTVEAGAAFIDATNVCQFTVDLSQADDLNQALIYANEQNIRVYYPSLFEVILEAPERGREKAICVRGSLDNTFIRVVGVKGIYGLKVRNPKDPDKEEEEALKTVEELNAEAKMLEELRLTPPGEGYKYIRIEPGTSVKFNHRRHGPTQAHVVAMLVISPIGTKLEEITYADRPEETATPVAEEGALVPQGAASSPAPEAGGEMPKFDIPPLDLPKE